VLSAPLGKLSKNALHGEAPVARRTDMRCLSIALAPYLALFVLLGCAGERAGAPPASSPPASEPLRPLPPPDPIALAAAAGSDLLRELDKLPCPPPGLDPALAAGLDCAAMRRFADAVSYVPRHYAAGSLPARIDLRAHGLSGPVKDQAMVGSCAGFAMSTVMDNAARRAGRGDVVAPLHIFSKYANRPSFSSELLHQPITVEPVWPYDPARACRLSAGGYDESCGQHYGVQPGSGYGDPYLMGERARADQSGYWRIDGFEEIAPEALDLNQLALILASGESIWISLAFHRPAWDSLHGGGDQLPFYPLSDQGGAHAVTLEGYRARPGGRDFLIHNSWGQRWAAQGYAWIDERMLATHLRYAYRARVVDAALPPPAAPADCPSGQRGPFGLCLPGATAPPSWLPSPGDLSGWMAPLGPQGG